MCRMSWKCGSLNLLEPSGPHRACNGTAVHWPTETARKMKILIDIHYKIFIYSNYVYINIYIKTTVLM
jgi:hypothetical protein